jgi:type VII secretion protein EccB
VQSRRDQLQAYKFLTRRALAALVTGEPDVPEAPMRRLSLTTVTGIMIAILVAGGFAVVGLLRPGSNTKIESNTIYIERNTGAQFVLLPGDGKLHPALNYTSAVLALAANGESSKIAVKTVPTSVLSHKPHGATIGIPDIPQSLPRSASGLVGTPWTICSHIEEPKIDENFARVTVSVGDAGGATSLPPDAAAVVSRPGSLDRYLLWNGRRLQVAPEIETALGLQTNQNVVVGSSLLNALPQGPPLVVPTIPRAGQPGPTVGGKPTLVGQLIQITDSKSTLVVLSDGGVTSVGPMAAALLQTMKLNGLRLSPVPTTNAVALGLPQSKVSDQELQQFDGLPTDIPHVPDSLAQSGGVCVEYHDSTHSTLAYPAGAAPSGNGPIKDTPQSGVADEVDVPAGKAALVASDNGSATRYIVAAPGKKFAVAASTLGPLGFGNAQPLILPQQWLLLLPKGAALDPVAATKTS